MTFPENHALTMDLQRIDEIYLSVLHAIDRAESWPDQRELARWCEAQSLRFQRLGAKALNKETAA